ncbi:MAG: sugar ABC transporter permease [Thermomicrobiales bacterium]
MVSQARSLSSPSVEARESRRVWRTERGALAFITPALLCLLVTVAYPIAHSIWISFHRWNLVSNVQRWVGLENYADLFQDPALLTVFRVTAVYTGLSVAIELVLGLALALVFRAGLTRGLRGFPVLRILVLAPVLVAPLLWGFYFRSFFSPQFGVFNQLLEIVDLGPVLWVNDPALAVYSLVLADVWQWTPFMFSIILSGLLALHGDIAEAARVDGATPWRVFRDIELPLLQPVLLVAVLIRFIDSIKYLDLVLVITQGGPGTSTEILNYFAYRTAFQAYSMGMGATIALLVFAVIMGATVLLLRLLRSNDGRA